MESDFMVFPPEKGMSQGTVCSHSEEEASGVSPGRDDQNRFCEEILTGKAGGDPHGLIRIPVFGRGVYTVFTVTMPCPAFALWDRSLMDRSR
jgi:hypothetical protein